MNKKIKCIIMALTVCITSNSISAITNATKNTSSVEPQKASYGYFVDEYKKNIHPNATTPDTNPAIGLLSGFLELWQPGDSWNNGTKLNESILNTNIQRSIDVTANLTEEEKHYTYLFDRRHQSYSAIGGLKEYAPVFIEKTNAGTTIADETPEDAITVKYEDNGNNNGNWADTDSELGKMVELVNTLRGSYSTSNPSKNFYAYMRPFRWSEEVTLLETLEPVKKPVESAASDGGFPSGHTNAAYLASLALANSVPEKYSDLVLNASNIGDSRILAGMHSTLDVIGGRVLGTALSAAILNDSDNEELKQAAYEEGRTLISSDVEKETIEEKIENYKTNKDIYLERLTYGFEQIGESGKEMVVPKGAEVLLETRFPYLDETQRRYILKTTGIDSGYPVLDDTEGWGRLNLFEAANGYGSFETDVVVNMDASKGGLNAEDSWLNSIDGDGKLVKQGSGSLILAGDNTYIGGTIVEDGSLVAYSSTAVGNGEVNNVSGTIAENVEGNVVINNDFTQGDNGVLAINLESNDDCITINGNAYLDGTLKVVVEEGYTLSDKVKIIEYSQLEDDSAFDSIELEGIPANYDAKVVYENDGVYLVDANVELEYNIEQLKSLIENAEALDDSIYTVDSYEAVVKAIVNAKTVLEEENINNDFVLEALNSLQQAIDNLEEKKSEVVIPEEPDADTNTGSGTNSESGFDNNTTNSENVNNSGDKNNSSSGKLPQTGGTNAAISVVLGAFATIAGIFMSKKK